MSQAHRIAVLAGDGIGKEVMPEALRVLDAVQRCLGVRMELIPMDWASCDWWQQHGQMMPGDWKQQLAGMDAILFGAVGDWKYDQLDRALRPEQAILGLRRQLRLFANLRPAICHKELVHASSLKPDLVSGLDLLIVRELTGGIYFGEPRGRRRATDGRFPDTDEAFDTMRYARPEIERIARTAFEAARLRGGRLTNVDKANVLETSRFWRDTVIDVHKSYPDVELDHMYVDNAAMQLVREPKAFDVIVTGNLFGDILSDEAAMLTGSIGMLPSASLNEKKQGLYEPVHGSAPDIAGQDVANPLATILSAALMLRHSLQQPEAAARIESAVGQVLADGLRTADIHSEGTTRVGTQAMGDAVVAALAAH